MFIAVTHYTKEKIKGHLSRFLIEASPSIFVGAINRKTRNNIQEFISANTEPEERITLLWTTPTAQGYSSISYGKNNTRVEEQEGLILVKKLTPEQKLQAKLNEEIEENIIFIDDISSKTETQNKDLPQNWSKLKQRQQARKFNKK